MIQVAKDTENSKDLSSGDSNILKQKTRSAYSMDWKDSYILEEADI